jgi:hypothetical protein
VINILNVHENYAWTCLWFVIFAMLSHGFCHNRNIGFTTKCGVQGPMRPKECVYVWNTFSQMGESARDGTQWLTNALTLWELHYYKSCKCLKPWLQRKTNTKLNPQYNIKKVLKHRCLKCPHIVHLNLIYMNYDIRGGNQIGNLTPDHKPLESRG